MISIPVISKEDTLDIDSVQKMLKVENDLYGDILQSSLKDGHRKLGYKILTGTLQSRSYIKEKEKFQIDLGDYIKVFWCNHFRNCNPTFCHHIHFIQFTYNKYLCSTSN